MGVAGRISVGRIKFGITVVGSTSGKVDSPQPPATLDGNRYSCENFVKYMY